MERREAAVRIIEKVFFEGAFLQDALSLVVYEAEDGQLPDGEKKGTVFLSRGTAERKICFSSVLKRLTTGGLSRIKKTLRALLFVALFELTYGEAAEYAAVNAWVGLSEKLGFRREKGFVNAVLRGYLREKDGIWNALSLREKLSFSPFLYDLTVSSFGEEKTKEIGEWFLSEQSKRFSVRVNESRIEPEEFLRTVRMSGMKIEPTGVSASTYFISGFNTVKEIPGYREGWFYPEAPAMTLSVEELKDRIFTSGKTLRILDASASPGGKTLHFADLIALSEKRRGLAPGTSGSRILSADVSESKVDKLRENVSAYGFSNWVETEVYDATVKRPEGECFDIVNLDVPCSGFSVLSGKPEGKETVTGEGVETLVRTQRSILESMSGSVLQGGVLVYSTCTFDPKENGENVRWFLNTHSDYSLLTERLILPGEVPSDGFYFAIMERRKQR